MCNRYRLKAKPDELIEQFDLDIPATPIDAEYFPGKPVPVIVGHDDERQLAEMTWGFPPFKGKRPINNTRSEKAPHSPCWKRHLGRRCVFPLTEAIEWQHQINKDTGELRKVPHAIRFNDGRIGSVAGIYTQDENAPCCSMMTLDNAERADQPLPPARHRPAGSLRAVPLSHRLQLHGATPG